MKKSIVLGLLLFPLFIFGQNKLNVFSQHVIQNPVIVTNPSFFKLKNYAFQLSSVKVVPETEFTIYNKTTQLNDFYYAKRDTFHYQKSVFIPQNHLFQPKIDSFNPSGASDLGSAIVIGLLNTFIGKF